MKKGILTIIIALIGTTINAQSIGDTIVVNTFNYNSTTRDTIIALPDVSGVTYEKIIMQYSMRCKDGLVSSGSQTNKGCGEWDYSCNTYLVDSAHVDSVWATTPSHNISGFTGTTYNYVTQPFYNLYQYYQTQVSQTITSETPSVVNNGSIALSNVISTNKNSGRSQYLYKQAELNSAGVIIGNIDGIILTAQNSSAAKFFRVRVKSTSDTVLSAANVDTTGFIQVYFSDFNFVTGTNRIQFYTPYNWDGIANLIFEFSYTNSTPNLALNITGEQTNFTSGVIANNQYHVNTTAGNYISAPASNLSGITNEISFSFWARGNAGIGTTKTVAIFGSDPNGSKTFNVHLPWNNSRVYFDCGNVGGSYDRIDKAATTTQLQNKWNHWAFTKNATTGSMKIYLNGALFQSGTGKTRTLDIATLTFGANVWGSNIYGGDLDELRVWGTELSQSEIQNWMNRSIDNTHPQYANLVAYYPLNEGAGNSITDMATGTLTATFNGNATWSYERGRTLNTFFEATNSRPNLTILQGTYSLTTTAITTHDSLQVAPNNVSEYQIFPKYGTLMNDSIGEINQWTYWLADYQYIYDGLTGNVISSNSITPDGTINITNLDYLKRSPTNFEIMSFVTPYGINLDLGMEGKTWSFDVTDFTPFLNGNKRIYMTMGGQWQEDIDIKFLYIVGTPPADVLDIIQLWKVNKISYQSIINDTYFAPRDVMMNPNGKSFKIRSMITGHGQEGEFIPRTHFINIDGGNKEFDWQVWKTCGENPVYPQGGTWIYDRAGWCPGMATQLVESDITPFVTAGQTANIDYGLNTASGSSSYIVNHKMVTYGDPNHSLDAAISDIISPSNKVAYARTGQTCIEPTVVLTNTGSTTLTKATIQYWVNGEQNKKEFTWTGSLEFMESETVSLPSDMGLWVPVSGPENVFYAKVLQPNDGTDEYSFNNQFTSNFIVPDVLPEQFIIKFRTNTRGDQNSYTIINEVGNVVFSKSNLPNNTVNIDTISLGFGCYKLKLLDTGGNGINFWANNEGNGYFQIWKIPTGIAAILEPDFGNEITFNFTIGTPLATEEFTKNSTFKVYPNPSSGRFIIEGKDLGNAKVFVYDIMGKDVSLTYEYSNNKMVIDSQGLAKGMYFVNIIYKERVESKAIMIQ